MIAIIDYGISNIKSVALAVEEVAGTEVKTTNSRDVLERADKLILPGVCSYHACMDGLEKNDLIDLIKQQVLVKNIPILGICIGLQVFSTVGNEFGRREGLDLVKGSVERLAIARVPHIGWNRCKKILSSDVFADDEKYYYFANSFHFIPDDPSVIRLKTVLEGEMVAAIESDNIFGCQFHPERSGQEGLAILRRFTRF